MTREEQWLLEEKYAGKEMPEYHLDVQRLAKGEPLAYVIGWQPFLGLKIYLDSRPLIPRLETEWWTEQMLCKAKAIFSATGCPRAMPGPEGAKKSPSRATFLDLCAGSGAIGCAALSRLPNAHVFFGEIDLAHKPTIQKNIRKNDLDESRATIGIGDLFEPFIGETFDLIASNPPYIPADRTLPHSAADYEPARALYAGTDGLAIIRRIIADLPTYLTPQGEAWIECDDAGAEATKALCIAHGLSAEICTDQYDVPRVIVVHPMK